MKRHLITFCAMVCVYSSARADLISTASFSQQGGMGSELRFVLEFTTDVGWGSPVAPLFNQPILHADIGQTFTSDSLTPFFANNIALATDGNNNRVGFLIMTGGGSIAGSLFFEASVFYGAPHTPFYSGPADLMGHSITRATFHLDKLEMNGGSHTGDFYDFEGTVSFFDDSNLHDTPEPASFCLALLGAFGVVAWRKRRAIRPAVTAHVSAS